MPDETVQSALQRTFAPTGGPGSVAAGEWLRQQGYWQPGLPDITDERVLLRQFARKRQLAAMRGRTSTFLTGPRGIGTGLPTSDIARAFLMAEIGDEPGAARVDVHQTMPAPPPAQPPSLGPAGPTGPFGQPGLPGAAAAAGSRNGAFPESTSLSRLFSRASSGRLW